jgi:hydrogenase small subunit
MLSPLARRPPRIRRAATTWRSPRGAAPEPVRPDDERGDAGGLTRRAFVGGGLASVTLWSLGLLRCTAARRPGGVGEPAAGPGPQGAEDARVPVLWVEAAVCTGCPVALLAGVDPPVEDVLPALRFEFQETLMERSGAAAMERVDEVRRSMSGRYLLVVDGAIATGEGARATVVGRTSDGTEVTAERLVQDLAPHASSVVALGTCASHGGIPAAGPNPFRYAGVTAVVPGRVIRVPGCPPHPEWIAGVLLAAARGDVLPVDDLGRPTGFYARHVHDVCPRRPAYEANRLATRIGDPERCLMAVGCKGLIAPGDCPVRKWNGQSTCLGANHPCLGCTTEGFPDPRA